MRLGLFAAACLLALVFGCAQQQNADRAQPQPSPPPSSGVIKEINRLQVLQFQRNLTLADISNLGSMVKGNARMENEFAGLEFMAGHGYPNHVEHTLGSLYSIAANTTLLCPADALSHVGIYLKYNETGMAKDAVSEGARQLSAWEAMAREAAKKGAYPGLEKMLSVMKDEAAQMDAGNYSAAINDSDYLGQNGYC